MSDLQIERLIKLYRVALLILIISTGLTLVSLVGVIVGDSLGVFIPLVMGGGLFGPIFILFADAAAFPIVLWLHMRAKRLKVLGAQQAHASYRSIWGVQRAVGVLVSIAAVIMIPGLVFALEMGLAGLAVLVPVFAGAWIFVQALSIHRQIQTPVENNARDSAQSFASSSDLNPNRLGEQQVTTPNELNSLGLFLLFAAIFMLATNIFVELSLVNDLRNTPEFFGPDALLGDVSWSIGYAGVADLLVFGTLGLAVLVVSAITRRKMARSRFIAVVVVSVLQLAIFSGSLAPSIATFMGPSLIANNLQLEIDDAYKTIEHLKNIDPPAGFEGSFGEPFLEESNLHWGLSANTGSEAPIREKCTSVVQYAAALGAREWMRKDTRETGKVSDQTSATEACQEVLSGIPSLKAKRNSVYSDSFVMGGIANFAPNSPLTFDLMLMLTDPNSSNPNTYSFELNISTAYRIDPVIRDGDLSPGTVEVNELLNIVGQARLAEPDRNPTEPKFMREILAGYKYDIKLELVESKPGVADRIDLINSDATHLCLSIEPWDEERMAQPDPGWGYGMGGLYENLDELNGFGNYTDGGCKK